MSLNKIPEQSRREWDIVKTMCRHYKQMLSWWTDVTVSPWMPMTLLITTIWPLFLLFMSGRTSFSNRTSPKKLVSITVFISSMDWHSMGPIRPIPALLTARGSQDCQEILHKICIFAGPTAPLADFLPALNQMVWTYWECPPCAQAGCPHRLWWSPHHIRPAVWSPESCPEPDPLPRPAPRPYWRSSWWRTLQTNTTIDSFWFLLLGAVEKTAAVKLVAQHLFQKQCVSHSGWSADIYIFLCLNFLFFMLQHCVFICGVTYFTFTNVKTLSQTLVSGSAALLPSSHTTTILSSSWYDHTFWTNTDMKHIKT